MEFLQGSRGPSSDIGPGRGFLGRAGSGGKGTGGGIGGRGGKASRARRAEEPLASATVSTVIPPRAGKRKRHTETRIDCQRRLTRRRGDQATSHLVLHTNTAHDRHTGNTTQPPNTGSSDMEGITPPLVPVAFFSICVYSTFQNGFFCVSGHEILKNFVYFTWEHQKVAVLGSFCVTLCHISSGQIGFFKT